MGFSKDKIIFFVRILLQGYKFETSTIIRTWELLITSMYLYSIYIKWQQLQTSKQT